MLAESGLPYALLRNNWYSELITGQLPQVLAHAADERLRRITSKANVA